MIVRRAGDGSVGGFDDQACPDPIDVVAANLILEGGGHQNVTIDSQQILVGDRFGFRKADDCPMRFLMREGGGRIEPGRIRDTPCESLMATIIAPASWNSLAMVAPT